jgi:hypothetical protein
MLETKNKDVKSNTCCFSDASMPYDGNLIRIYLHPLAEASFVSKIYFVIQFFSVNIVNDIRRVSKIVIYKDIQLIVDTECDGHKEDVPKPTDTKK